MPTTPRSTRSPGSAPDRKAGQREPPHPPCCPVRDRRDRNAGLRQRHDPQLRGPVRLGVLSSGTGPAVIAVTAVLSVAFGWLIAGRLLRPLRAITATAMDISASNLSRRLRLGNRDDEF